MKWVLVVYYLINGAWISTMVPVPQPSYEVCLDSRYSATMLNLESMRVVRFECEQLEVE
jgi:hypothetical protein